MIIAPVPKEGHVIAHSFVSRRVSSYNGGMRKGVSIHVAPSIPPSIVGWNLAWQIRVVLSGFKKTYTYTFVCAVTIFTLPFLPFLCSRFIFPSACWFSSSFREFYPFRLTFHCTSPQRHLLAFSCIKVRTWFEFLLRPFSFCICLFPVFVFLSSLCRRSFVPAKQCLLY